MREPKRTAAASIDALIKQIASPVRWEDVVQRLASEGVTRYVEVGPGKALSGMIKRIASGATIQNVEGPDDLAAVEAPVLTAFDGKIAIVTGASRGSAARSPSGSPRAARRWCASRAAPTRRRPRRRSPPRAARPKRVGADVTDAAAVEGLSSRSSRQHGKLDILVSNAGITRDQLMLRMKRATGTRSSRRT